VKITDGDQIIQEQIGKNNKNEMNVNNDWNLNDKLDISGITFNWMNGEEYDGANDGVSDGLGGYNYGCVSSDNGDSTNTHTRNYNDNDNENGESDETLDNDTSSDDVSFVMDANLMQDALYDFDFNEADVEVLLEQN
jgi:hypothetical protein